MYKTSGADQIEGGLGGLVDIRLRRPFDFTEPQVLAVLDWELSTLGHPLADFSYHLMMYRMPQGLSSGLAGLDLTALNIPSEADYVAAYCRRTGREPRRSRG